MIQTYPAGHKHISGEWLHATLKIPGKISAFKLNILHIEAHGKDWFHKAASLKLTSSEIKSIPNEESPGHSLHGFKSF